MKRIKLNKGTARVDENIKPGTLQALNTMAQMAYQMHSTDEPFCSCKDPEIHTDENGINYCKKCKVEVALLPFKPVSE